MRCTPDEVDILRICVPPPRFSVPLPSCMPVLNNSFFFLLFLPYHPHLSSLSILLTSMNPVQDIDICAWASGVSPSLDAFSDSETQVTSTKITRKRKRLDDYYDSSRKPSRRCDPFSYSALAECSLSTMNTPASPRKEDARKTQMSEILQSWTFFISTLIQLLSLACHPANKHNQVLLPLSFSHRYLLFLRCQTNSE